MRTLKILLGTLLPVCAAGFAAASCFDGIAGKDGASIVIYFEGFTPVGTRASDVTDTDDYILTVTGADGDTAYCGRFGDSPEVMTVSPGTYTISAMSRTFDCPAYDAPLFGDTKVVVVASGESAAVALNCSMLNCGMRLVPDGDFKDAFPSARLLLKGDGGSLQFNYGETRTAYFEPGDITVSMENGGASEKLFSRSLEARQMLTIGLSAASTGPAAGISVSVDTTREWLRDSFTYGERSSSPEDALDVSEARNAAGSAGVWVYGYIVGCATSTSKVEFDPPFSKNTNIVLGERSSTSDRAYCLSVELKSGAIRDALNLPGNPSLEGRKVWLKGDLVASYYGLPGLKNVTEYSF